MGLTESKANELISDYTTSNGYITKSSLASEMKKLNLIPNTVVQSNMRKNLRALTTTTDTCPCKLVNNQVVFDKEVTFLDNVFAKKDIACKGAYMGEMGGVNEVLASAKLYNPTIVSGPPNVQPNIKTFDGKRLLIDTNLDLSRSAAFHAGLVVVNPLKTPSGIEFKFGNHKTGIVTMSRDTSPSGIIYSTTNGLYQNPYGAGGYGFSSISQPSTDYQQPSAWVPEKFNQFY